MKPELTATPRLAPGVRLNEKSQLPRTLLMPERALRLNGPSLEIVQLCDGHHTVQQIAEKLHLSIKTVETYQAHIKDKLSLHSGRELVQHAIQANISEKTS